MFYIYILQSLKDNKLYTGYSSSLKKRLSEHETGIVVSTKNRRPFELIYYEAYKSEKDARSREHNLKLRANALTQLKRRLEKSLN